MTEQPTDPLTNPEAAPPATMRAAVIDRFGGGDAIELRTLPVPEVGPDDVLIRVAAAGVGSWDAVERAGGYDGAFGIPSSFPYVLGWDAAGTVAALGERVTRLRIGERVYAASMPLPRGGCYAEYTVVDQDHVAPVPEGLSMIQAAAMPWDALTALSGLDALETCPGTTLLVFGASGGIGHLAVQLARHAGARVLAAASGRDGVELAARLGAEAVVDGRREDVVAAARAFAPAGFDAALVTVGGEAANRALAAVRAGGRVAFPNGVVPEPEAPPGVRALRYDGVRDQAATSRLNRLVASGPFEVHVAASFPLDRAADAHEALAAHYVGKLALRVT
jgi:NADPH2:quinone reductase